MDKDTSILLLTSRKPARMIGVMAQGRSKNGRNPWMGGWCSSWVPRVEVCFRSRRRKVMTHFLIIPRSVRFSYFIYFKG